MSEPLPDEPVDLEAFFSDWPTHAGPARDWPIPPMDHAPGFKESAFTWPMGRLITQRIIEGETVREITADPRMPSYATVFRWMQVWEVFGEAVRMVRAMAAADDLADRADAAARARAEVAARRARGERVRWWVSGRRSTYDPAVAERVLRALEDGASLSELVRRPGWPSFKAWYRWLKVVPGLADLYVEACRRRDVRFELALDEVIEFAAGPSFADANAVLTAIAGRRGRLRPKLYRPGALRPPTLAEGPDGGLDLVAPGAPERTPGRPTRP